MLKIQGSKLAEVPFTLEINDQSHELVMTQYTIKDHFRLLELQKPLFESGEITGETTAKIIMSRVAASVKNQDGTYHFTGTLDEMIQSIPAEAVFALSVECDKLNPISVGELDDKKK